MPEPQYFDANCAVGRSPHPLANALHSDAELRAAATELGISRRLITYAPARDWSPEVGNDELGGVLDPAAGDVGCWVADPLDFLDADRIAGRLDEIKAAGFRAIRLYPDPAVHNYRLDAVSLLPLLRELERESWPLVIDTGAPQWSGIEDILDAVPVRVILCGLGYRHARSLYPLLARHDTLAVETSSFLAFGALEDVVARFGAGALVFGTNSPVLSMGAAVARLELADLTETDRSAIAFGNLDRMLGGRG